MMMQYSVFEKGRSAPGKPHHMYVVIEDSETGEKWIARGGPDAKGIMFFAKALTDTLKLTSEVTTADKNQDTQVIKEGNKLVSILDSTVIEGISGREAANQDQEYSNAVNEAAIDYTAHSNSNSFAAGAYKDLTGRSAGNSDNWGKDRDPSQMTQFRLNKDDAWQSRLQDAKNE
ncbi:hypothetical protein PQU94_09015 [Asticcacaulis sp. DXS10W]|uniref:Uncharacterized protein n=1 Tax=Asticcacaulis currens TaxID=2984210 RepID=A0ABT5IEY0_9CAUL|nr:hypothetical protein [Asticcacaulis currens]MDC7694420.1 hypothetical protein [Asticcacaulis currens]